MSDNIRLGVGFGLACKTGFPYHWMLFETLLNVITMPPKTRVNE